MSRTDLSGRRALLLNKIKAGQPAPNGIDFLEVTGGRKVLRIRFFQAAAGLSAAHFVIEGGERVTAIKPLTLAGAGILWDLTLDRAGDFSTYTLRLVDPAAPERPPAGFDPLFSQVRFSFRADCGDGYDCLEQEPCPPEPLAPAPALDYTARDYDALRRMMLDRLAQVAPQMDERSPADLAVTLVEAMAYWGDRLSYYQDAVAAEATLGTARRRVSVRRHARLLDYPVDEGSAARAWVCLRCAPAADQKILPGPRPGQPGTLFLAGAAGPSGVLDANGLRRALAQGAQGFEALHDLMLFSAHNRIAFYTWGEDAYALPRGATRAWLKDDPAARLRLMPGDVLIFEEALNPQDGSRASADPDKRHAVRLTAVTPSAELDSSGGAPVRNPGALQTDPLTGAAYVEIAWESEDALPFALCAAAEINGAPQPEVSVVYGNVVLVDHGRTVPGALPGENPATLQQPRTAGARPRLPGGRPAWTAPYDPTLPAARSLITDSGDALPAVWLLEEGLPGVRWSVQADLLGSDRFARDFVVEPEDDGFATLRFGDGVYGMTPVDLNRLRVVARQGGGRGGNVGAGAIAQVVTTLPGLLDLRNPLPAQGGRDPESVERVRLLAPQAFRRNERCVTPEDYAARAAMHPEVQRAAADLRWTGSWHTVFITVDRKAGRPVDPAFREDLTTYLEPYRLAGHDLEVRPPLYAPLDIRLEVCARDGVYRTQVEAAVYETLSNRALPGGQLGFFHPDRFTFGTPLSLSQLLAAVLQVEGVESVKATRFQRWGRPPETELADWVILAGALEVLRLDNDRNFPENGRLEVAVGGGL